MEQKHRRHHHHLMALTTHQQLNIGKSQIVDLRDCKHHRSSPITDEQSIQLHMSQSVQANEEQKTEKNNIYNAGHPVIPLAGGLLPCLAMLRFLHTFICG